MKFLRQLSLAIILCQLFFLSAAVAQSTQQTTVNISTAEQLKEEFATTPCKDKERLSAAKALFEKFGAPSADISIDHHKNVENLVVRKQGTTKEIIVLGAHYDKVADGCGAVDNWTGIVTLAHLYKTLKDVPLKKTVLFVAFGKEEEGLIGSHALVAAISKDQLPQYCEMINMDSFGLAAPQVADNMSSKKLSAFAAELAKEMKMPFGHATIPGADSDSSSFMAREIPALTVHGLNNDWPKILHSSKDQTSKIIADSVYLGYRLVLALVVRLDPSPCGQYR